jgi:hypothetical protein
MINPGNRSGFRGYLFVIANNRWGKNSGCSDSSISEAFDLPDILSNKGNAPVAADDSGRETLRIIFQHFTGRKICTDDRGLLRHQPRVHDVVDLGAGERIFKLRTQIVQNQQVAIQKRLACIAFIPAEMFALQLGDQVIHRTVNDPEPLLDRGVRNGKGHMSFSKPGAARHDQIGRAQGKLVGIVHTEFQSIAHDLPLRFLPAVFNRIWVIVEGKRFKCGKGKRGQRVKPTVRFRLQELFHTIAHFSINISGVSA